MAYAGVRRNNFEILKTFLAPAQESVALDIAFHFEVGVEEKGVCGARFIYLHGMVDDKLGRKQRIDFFGVAAKMAHCVAHGGEINDSGNARKILEQDTCGHEGNFFFGSACRTGGIPSGEGADVFRADEAIIFVTEKIFEEDFEREGQARWLSGTGALEGVEAVDFEGVAADFEGGAGAEGILG